MTAQQGVRPVPEARRPADGPDRRPHVTVVVPTILSRGEVVTRCLRSLLRQTYPAFDVVVVDNRPAGAPDAGHLVPDDPRLTLVREPRPGGSAARNAGLARVSGEIVAFTDDDVEADPGWLEALVARLVGQPELDVVTGLIEPGELTSDAQRWFEDFYGGFASPRSYDPVTYRLEPGPGGRRQGLVAETDPQGRELRRFSVFGVGAVGAGANMAFRTARLRALGGFDPRLGPGTPAMGGEDLAVFLRALWTGCALGYEPAAVVRHTHRPDVAGLRRQLRGYGVGFGAMLTSLVVADPRLLVPLVGRLPRAARVRGAEVFGRLRGRTAPQGVPAVGSPYPRSLVWIEALGWAAGPVAFARSALRPAARS